MAINFINNNNIFHFYQNGKEENPCLRVIPTKINYNGFGARISQRSKCIYFLKLFFLCTRFFEITVYRQIL